MNGRARDLAIWILVVVFALFNAFKPLMPGTPFEKALPAVSILSMLGFVLLHAPRQIGWPRLAAFFAIAFVVSWAYESASIATGFPFGNYHYTEKMGPKLGTVPLLIMPAYFAICYVSWHLAHAVLDKFDQRVDALQTWAAPVLAALIMVMWDMAMDPARSTHSAAWVWHDGGAYFGVPFRNFMGWLLCVWTIFQLYALLLRRSAKPAGVTGTAADSRHHWHQMTGLYGALVLEFLSFALFPPGGTVTDRSGAVWRLSDLYETLGLVTIFSMLFVTVLALVKVQVSERVR